MAKSVIKQCRYGHCLHEDKTINIETDEYEEEGRSYYHKDCYKVKRDAIQIKNLWHDHIDSLVIYSQLNSVINDLIFKEHVSSDYILFAIKYAVDHKSEINLKYPPGIKYIIKRECIKDAYKKEKAEKIKKAEFIAHDDDSKTPTFSSKPKSNFGFGSVLGGKR